MDIRPLCTAAEKDAYFSLISELFSLDPAHVEQMRCHPTINRSTLFGAFHEVSLIGALSRTPLTFGFGDAVGLSAVCVRPEFRKRGIGREMMSEAVGDSPALLFADRPEMYLTAGFKVVDRVIRGPIECWSQDQTIPLSQAKRMYESMAERDMSWLRRTDDDWRGGVIHEYRPCEGGYLCWEPGICRDAVVNAAMDRWPVPPGTNWIGLESVTKQMSVPLVSQAPIHLVMTKGMEEDPRMMMRDQF